MARKVANVSKDKGAKQVGARTVYTGKSLRSVAMPMGGIGTGQIALCGDGSLRQWQIFNIPNHLAYVPNSFFAIHARTRVQPLVTRILQTSIAHDETGFTPAKCVNDHVVPDGLRKLMKKMRGVDNIEYIGEYPIAELRYLDKEFPFDVTCEAFSPMWPLEAKDSGIPAIVFNFKFKNTGDKRQDFALTGTLQNAVGFDGVGHIKGTRFPGYGGNLNIPLPITGLTGVLMSKIGLETNHEHNGTMAIAAFDPNATARLRWQELRELDLDLELDGKLTNVGPNVASAPGETWNSAVTSNISLDPGEEKSLTFVIAWHFANHYVNWDQVWLGAPDTSSHLWLGTMYGNWFKDAGEVVRYVKDNYDRLCADTRKYRDTFYNASIPYQILDAVTSQVSTIRTPTCLWNQDGRFHGFEGCHGSSTGDWRTIGGCCPMNCTHVWNYEQALSRVFPDLERLMRKTDFVEQAVCCGGVSSRTALPLSLPRWTPPADREDSSVVACDGHFGAILKLYREVQINGDPEYLKEMWPRVRTAMAFAFKRWDVDGDGMCDKDKAQWNTYDINYYGWNTYIGTLYLGALRAAEEMALRMGEKNVAAEYRRRFESGREITSTAMWNGEYYIQIYDDKKYTRDQYGKGCLSDQLIGQWWAHELGLGYLLPEEQVKKTLCSIYKYNFRRNFKGFKQDPRVFCRDEDKGLLICTWPKGGRPEVQTCYADEVWSGIEYQVASHMIYEGMVAEGMELVKAARDRYNGEYRSPWNEVECGDHYVRPMSSWSVLHALGGYRWDGLDKTIRIAPQVNEPYRAFFITGDGWGTIQYIAAGRVAKVSLEVAHGTVEVKCILTKPTGKKVSTAKASVGAKAAAAIVEMVDGEAKVTLKKAASLKAGDKLSVEIA